MAEHEITQKELGQNNSLKELGKLLTERRENLGMTLETVFDRTRIRPEYLRGIEAGDYTDFPEIVYIKGFLRTYLKLVGAEDLQKDFMTQLDRMEHSQHTGNNKWEARQQNSSGSANILGSGSAMPKGFKPVSHFWLFLVLAAALIGTGVYVWYAITYGGLDLKNLKLFSFTGNNGGLTIEVASEDVIIESVSGDLDENVSADEEANEDSEPEEEISPYLEIHAVNDVWLSVAFGNAQPTFRRTLRRGEVMRWDLTAPARVVIGRPTAAQVILNGQDLGIVNPSAKKSETYIYNVDGTYRKVR